MTSFVAKRNKAKCAVFKGIELSYGLESSYKYTCRSSRHNLNKEAIEKREWKSYL